MTTPDRAVRSLRHPVLELAARYAAITRAAWALRHELAGPRRLRHEAAFLPAALALQETPPHPAPRRLALAICLLFTVALTWACLGEVDIVAVATGRIVVGQHSKTLQPLEAGVVKAIHVRDGAKVRAGDLLIELDGTITQADSSRLAQERSAATSEALRADAVLAALRDGRTPSLPASRLAALTPGDRASATELLQREWADITAKLAKLAAEIAHRKAEIATAEQAAAKIDTTLPLARRREADFQALTTQGFMSGHAGQDRTRERIELERDLATAHARLDEARAALAESEHGLLAWRAETQRTLQDRAQQADLKARQSGEEVSKADKRQQLTQLRAPVTGTVQQLAVHTTGGVVTPAQILLVLVPDDDGVTAEVVLDNKDIGFVQPRQPATLKFETFPYTRYGTVPASVTRIAADAVQDDKRGAVFPVTLALGLPNIQVEGRGIRLTPGMNLTAEIKTGHRRLIEFLVSPIHNHLSESFSER